MCCSILIYCLLVLLPQIDFISKITAYVSEYQLLIQSIRKENREDESMYIIQQRYKLYNMQYQITSQENITRLG